MYELWNSENTFPSLKEMRTIEGLEHIIVHEAHKDGSRFLLGAAIIKHSGTLYCSFVNSLEEENDSFSMLAQKKSYDGGKSWTDYRSVSKNEAVFSKSHGVYLEHEGSLYAFCPRAKFTPTAYPELTMEAYRENEIGEWDYLGIVLDRDFWPMCQPIMLDDGSYVMAGLKTDEHTAAVAVCDGNDITKWEMHTIPVPKDLWIWGETTVLKLDGRLLAIVRGGGEVGYAMVSESLDGGKSWSELADSNLFIAQSKMYAGTLSNGDLYVVFTVKSEGYRDTLCIAVGRKKFERIYLIRHGFDASPKFQPCNEWCYPYAYEDRESEMLYVVYSKNKEDCELAIIPVESLGK